MHLTRFQILCAYGLDSLPMFSVRILRFGLSSREAGRSFLLGK